mmetsp:Transcript_25471/g.19225  ORF Transcript_25471/g.19225 Transcript_25471/m.19225 type:complete len:143 (+) Transcript_25471:113-541(+)
MQDEMEFWPGIKKVLSFSVFPIISFLFHPAYSVINTIVLGQMENSAILQASLGLGLITTGMFLQSITVGLSSGLQTLATQAFGAGDPQLCGVYCNRQIVINLAANLITSVALWFIYDIYILIGQDPEVAWNAAIYVKVGIVG